PCPTLSHTTSLLFLFSRRRPPSSPLFPYTTLFRSCQEVFLRVYLARDRYQETGTFSTWLFRVAMNVGRDALRRRPRPSVPFEEADRKSTRLNSSHLVISYAVFCLKKKKK